jgi:hypothetical protein
VQLVVLFALVSAGSALPGVTCEFPTTTCVGVQPASQNRAEWEATVAHPDLSPLPPAGTDDWWLLDSVRLTGELTPGSRIILGLPQWWDSIATLETMDTLPPACRATLASQAPWLRPLLASAFRRLGDSAAVFYANLIDTTPAPWKDEVAFTVATIGPEVLTNHVFNPAVIGDNARWVYLLDDSLPYVELVERSHSDGPYTTARYRVLQGTDTVWVELPRDIYYYYVVHPTTSDEIPRLDDYVYNKHWREYFFCDADSGFPRLGDYIKQAQVVWFRQRQVEPVGRPFEPGDNALDVIGNWVTRTNVAGASGNRPIHPNVIAHEHNGNCGEIQDLWTAACRTCLIPTVNCSDPCEDHVWNEFWDGSWLPLASDPATHIADSGVAYEEAHGGSKRISGVFNWRPDGLWWSVTGHFSNACSLYVRVLDALGRPMDGCRVLVYSEGWYGGLSTCTGGCTDANGAVPFELGDLRNFYLQVGTPLGTWPDASNSTRVVTTSQTGAVYFSTLYMPWTMDAPRPQPVSYDPDTTRLGHKLAIDLGVAAEMDYGYAVIRGAGTGDPDDSIRFYHYYADAHPGGTMDYFALDSTGHDSYAAGDAFAALLAGDDVPTRRVLFFSERMYPHRYPAWFVLSGEDKLSTSRWLDCRADLWFNPGAVSENRRSSPHRLGRQSVFRGRLTLAPDLSGIPTPVRIYSASGRLVRSVVIGNSPLVIPGLADGAYFITQGSSNPTRRVVVVR